MIIEKTKLDGVLLIKPDVFEDYRGNYTEVYNEKMYFASGIKHKFIQDDLSTTYKGVLRGMHGDSKTTKLVQCAYGRIYQVVCNCNPDSPQYGSWEAFILTSENRNQLLVPPMFGNGFYVLSDVAVYSYKQTTNYGDVKQFTVKWNDPFYNIVWPDDKPILSIRDK
ncbi:MAG: dTDP-4-dehydrorhamnose 3,5-epimerase family protein [Acholeplasma sp.]|nr:dTDP-4-dehydrorhamnose 3,5-epimerase family protein [Acholeplasma sp.]